MDGSEAMLPTFSCQNPELDRKKSEDSYRTILTEKSECVSTYKICTIQIKSVTLATLLKYDTMAIEWQCMGIVDWLAKS